MKEDTNKNDPIKLKKFDDLTTSNIKSHLKDSGVLNPFLLKIAEKFLDLGIC